MMKKVLTILLAVGMLLSFSGCGQGNVMGVENGQIVTEADQQKQQAASQAEEAKKQVTDESVEDSIGGLETYLTSVGAIAENPSKTEMQGDFIGASKGYKYTFSYGGNNNISMELYEYDPKNLNETAQKVVSGLQKDGKFSVLGIDVSGYLSNSGKYLLIYKDTAQGHEAHTEEVLKAFREFKA